MTRILKILLYVLQSFYINLNNCLFHLFAQKHSAGNNLLSITDASVKKSHREQLLMKSFPRTVQQ